MAAQRASGSCHTQSMQTIVNKASQASNVLPGMGSPDKHLGPLSPPARLWTARAPTALWRAPQYPERARAGQLHAARTQLWGIVPTTSLLRPGGRGFFPRLGRTTCEACASTSMCQPFAQPAAALRAGVGVADALSLSPTCVSARSVCCTFGR